MINGPFFRKIVIFSGKIVINGPFFRKIVTNSNTNHQVGDHGEGGVFAAHLAEGGAPELVGRRVKDGLR